MVKIREWTEKEIKLLRELYTSNQTFDEIVTKFPLRTENAIRLKASRLGLKRPIIGDINQIKPLNYKFFTKGGLSGYLLKCNDCGSWTQVDEDTTENTGVISCGKCGNYNQVMVNL